MTLLVTECSTSGVAMAADSAITKIAKGKIVEVDQKEWRKVLMPMRVLPHLELAYAGRPTC